MYTKNLKQNEGTYSSPIFRIWDIRRYTILDVEKIPLKSEVSGWKMVKMETLLPGLKGENNQNMLETTTVLHSMYSEPPQGF